MNPAQFREIRRALGLSVKGLADLLGVEGRSVRRWEDDSVTDHGSGPSLPWPIPGPVQRLMVLLELEEMPFEFIAADPRIEKKKEG